MCVVFPSVIIWKIRESVRSFIVLTLRIFFFFWHHSSAFILLLSACHVSLPISICTKLVLSLHSSLLQLIPAASGCCFLSILHCLAGRLAGWLEFPSGWLEPFPAGRSLSLAGWIVLLAGWSRQVCGLRRAVQGVTCDVCGVRWMCEV